MLQLHVYRTFFVVTGPQSQFSHWVIWEMWMAKKALMVHSQALAKDQKQTSPVKEVNTLFKQVSGMTLNRL